MGHTMLQMTVWSIRLLHIVRAFNFLSECMYRFHILSPSSRCLYSLQKAGEPNFLYSNPPAMRHFGLLPSTSQALSCMYQAASVKGGQGWGAIQTNIWISEMTWKRKYSRGTWVAQLVEHPTLGSSSGHDSRSWDRAPGWALYSVWSLLEIVSLSLLLPFLHWRMYMCVLSQINIIFKKENIQIFSKRNNERRNQQLRKITYGIK